MSGVPLQIIFGCCIDDLASIIRSEVGYLLRIAQYFNSIHNSPANGVVQQNLDNIQGPNYFLQQARVYPSILNPQWHYHPSPPGRFTIDQKLNRSSNINIVVIKSNKVSILQVVTHHLKPQKLFTIYESLLGSVRKYSCH